MKRILVIAALLFVVQSALGQRTKEHKKNVRAFHTILLGDCDTDFAKDAYQEALVNAAESERLAVIELAPGFVEPSIINSMMQATSARKCELVLIVSRSKRVDARLLLLMQLADGVVVDDDVVFSLKRPDEVRDTEAVLNERQEMVECGSSPELAKLLTFGAKVAWMNSMGEITLSASPAPTGVIVLVDESGVRIETKHVQSLGIRRNADLKSVWRTLDKTSVRIDEPQQVFIGAVEIASELDRRLADVKTAVDRMDKLLNLPDPQKREVAVTKYRIAIDHAFQIAEGAHRILEEVEARLRSAPQVLRIPPSGEPFIDSSKESHASAWKSRIKSCRTTLERLKSRARELESAVR